ncbi:MAG: SlyX family protein [Porticoccaceae bacterium]|jgi:SlyX protein|nr:SlyX family protein [Porticoccaceae bacterium]HLS97708.1 SlyX family protein [Porticoccaceae bacterium]
MMDSERITELEVRLAYQEDTLNALNGVVSRQGERIELLERMNRELYARLMDILDDHKGAKPGDEPPPPHY